MVVEFDFVTNKKAKEKYYGSNYINTLSWVLKQKKKPIFLQNKKKQWYTLPTSQKTFSENRNACYSSAALCTQNYLVCFEYPRTTSDVYAHHGPCS